MTALVRPRLWSARTSVSDCQWPPFPSTRAYSRRFSHNVSVELYPCCHVGCDGPHRTRGAVAQGWGAPPISRPARPVPPSHVDDVTNPALSSVAARILYMKMSATPKP